MAASLRQHLACMQILLQRGAQVNTTSKAGETALFWCKTLETAELLLQHGADPRIRNVDGKTVFQYYGPSLTTTTRPLFSTWTPFNMLPPFNRKAYPLYCDHCPGFASAIMTTLLMLLRYRRLIPRDIGVQIIAAIANGHREEQWWPIEGFSMAPYMSDSEAKFCILS